MDFIRIKKIRSCKSYGLRNTNAMHIAAMKNTNDNNIIMANYAPVPLTRYIMVAITNHIINLRIHYIILNSSTDP